MVRTIVYVGGFNLYYGALRRSGDKWLDLAAYFRMIQPTADLKVVRYFSALVTGQAGVDQQAYLDALATTPLVSITLGKYKPKTIRCGVTGCRHVGSREFRRWEEKQSDVNIALALLDDAYRHAADHFVLVSGDTDLVPDRSSPGAQARQVTIATHPPIRLHSGSAQLDGNATGERCPDNTLVCP